MDSMIIDPETIASLGGMSLEEKIGLLIRWCTELDQKVEYQRQRITALENRAPPSDGNRSTSLPAAITSINGPTTWSTLPADAIQLGPSNEVVDLELVLIPFMSYFQHLWSSEHQVNTQGGSASLWTLVDPKAKWLDPLIPQPKDIDDLNRWGLIKRVQVRRDNNDPIKGFREAFRFSLSRVSNIAYYDSLSQIHQNSQYSTLDGDPLPEWAEGLIGSILPLRPSVEMDGVLEYLLQTELRSPQTWSLERFLQPDISTLVQDPNTGKHVYRMFFTSVEGYLGFMRNDFGLGTWGMEAK